MTATYRPIRCPHGTDLTHVGYLSTYKDGCRATPSGSPARFWCGFGEMDKRDGVSITEGEYLRDWDAALTLNEFVDLEEEDATENPVAMEYDICNGCGGLCELNAKGLCSVCDNAGFLGEVPWTDRIED